MFEWLSDNRALIAALLNILLVALLVWSIVKGRREARLRAHDEVFGDPVRTKGGWYWSVTGVCTLLLVWSYYSWGVARAYFPNSANEMCQVAKLDAAVSPIKAALPIGSRYYKSTLLAVRNSAQLDALLVQLPDTPFTPEEKDELVDLIKDIRGLIANASDPDKMSGATRQRLVDLSQSLNELGGFLIAGPGDMTPTAEALAQPKWGTSFVEIPMLPITPRGGLFDRASV